MIWISLSLSCHHAPHMVFFVFFGRDWGRTGDGDRGWDPTSSLAARAGPRRPHVFTFPLQIYFIFYQK
jgi:hypothetical protein